MEMIDIVKTLLDNNGQSAAKGLRNKIKVQRLVIVILTYSGEDEIIMSA